MLKSFFKLLAIINIPELRLILVRQENAERLAYSLYVIFLRVADGPKIQTRWEY